MHRSFWVNDQQRLTHWTFKGITVIIMLFMVLWKMPRARACQFFSSGLGFGLETQKPGLGLGLGLETCWTRTRTRVLRIWTRTRTRTRDMRTRTRLGLEETRTRCISAALQLCWAPIEVSAFNQRATPGRATEGPGSPITPGWRNLHSTRRWARFWLNRRARRKPG